MMGSEIIALAQVIFIDLVLSGDNAVVIGLAAASLPEQLRKRAILAGTGLAVALRVGFSFAVVHLLAFKGINLAGGILLFWVCWKMFQDIRSEEQESGHVKQPKSVLHCVGIIAAADLSMSIDNVLAVAGASQEHPMIMAFGLILSVGLMVFAANVLSPLFNKYKWLSWAGLALIVYVAFSMTLKGITELNLIG